MKAVPGGCQCKNKPVAVAGCRCGQRIAVQKQLQLNSVCQVAPGCIAVRIEPGKSCGCGQQSPASQAGCRCCKQAAAPQSGCGCGKKAAVAIQSGCSCGKKKAVAIQSGCGCGKKAAVAIQSGCSCGKKKAAAIQSGCGCGKKAAVATQSGCSCGKKQAAATPSGCGCGQQKAAASKSGCGCGKKAAAPKPGCKCGGARVESVRILESPLRIRLRGNLDSSTLQRVKKIELVRPAIRKDVGCEKCRAKQLKDLTKVDEECLECLERKLLSDGELAVGILVPEKPKSAPKAKARSL